MPSKAKITTIRSNFCDKREQNQALLELCRAEQKSRPEGVILNSQLFLPCLRGTDARSKCRRQARLHYALQGGRRQSQSVRRTEGLNSQFFRQRLKDLRFLILNSQFSILNSQLFCILVIVEIEDSLVRILPLLLFRGFSLRLLGVDCYCHGTVDSHLVEPIQTVRQPIRLCFLGELKPLDFLIIARFCSQYNTKYFVCF